VCVCISNIYLYRIDEYCIVEEEKTGFMPVGRPRQWREKCFETLRKTVKNRIEGNQLEDRTLNKQWLARCVVCLV
jgi:exocyst complex component 3